MILITPKESFSSEDNFMTIPPLVKAGIPAKYDLRDYNLVSPVKDQGQYDNGWAFAAIGAMESNYMKTYGKSIDLSEMHLAYFSFINSDKSKAFYNVKTFDEAMHKNGNSLFPTAL